MSRLSSYDGTTSSGNSVQAPIKPTSRFEEALRVSRFWEEVCQGICNCARLLRANPRQVVLNTQSSMHEIRQRFLNDYLLLNHEDAGYTHADFLWVYWAHLLVTGSLQHRGSVSKEFATQCYARVSLAIAEFPHRKFDVDRVSLQRVRDEFSVLEWDCAKVVVFYCSHSQELEPFYTSGLIQSALPVDTEDDAQAGNDEFTEEEQQYMASKEFQQLLLKEQQKTKEERESEWKEELKQSQESYRAKLTNLSAFMPSKWSDSVFVGKCSRLFCWIELHVRVLLGPNIDLKLEDRHPALADPVTVRSKVTAWITNQGKSAVYDKLRPEACNLLYILHSTLGAREQNLRRKIGANWYTVSDWNVFMSDVDKLYAQAVAVRMSDHYNKILEEEPDDSLYRLAWYIRFFCLPMEAYSSFDLMKRGYFVLSNALLLHSKHLQSHLCGGRARRAPVIVQCFNRFWVQEAALNPLPSRTHTVWKCDNVLEAMYLWTHLVVHEHKGFLDHKMPLNEKYKNML